MAANNDHLSLQEQEQAAWDEIISQANLPEQQQQKYEEADEAPSHPEADEAPSHPEADDQDEEAAAQAYYTENEAYYESDLHGDFDSAFLNHMFFERTHRVCAPVGKYYY